MSDSPVRDTPATARHARYGVILFAIYFVIYAAFVYLSAFRADLMASKPFGGVNFAVLYGMALIIAAFVLALVYWLLCRAHIAETSSDQKGGLV